MEKMTIFYLKLTEIQPEWLNDEDGEHSEEHVQMTFDESGKFVSVKDVRPKPGHTADDSQNKSSTKQQPTTSAKQSSATKVDEKKDRGEAAKSNNNQQQKNNSQQKPNEQAADLAAAAAASSSSSSSASPATNTPADLNQQKPTATHDNLNTKQNKSQTTVDANSEVRFFVVVSYPNVEFLIQIVTVKV